MSDILDKLKKYYEKNGISALNFNCKHCEDCRRGYEKTFTPATESFVGTKYGIKNLPRLVIISRDPKNSDENPEKRTLIHHRDASLHPDYYNWAISLRKDSHWRSTLKLVYTVLDKFDDFRKEGISEPENVIPYFTHVNSAKCCVDYGGNPAPIKFFKNCKEYIPDEISILEPDIIITQGKEAKNSISGAFPLTRSEKISEQLYCYDTCQVVEINNKKVLWIHTYHPSYYKRIRQYKKQIECFNVYAEIAYDFVIKSIIS